MLWLALPIALACEGPARTADVLDAVGRAEIAWVALDAAAFDLAAADARAALACLGEPLSVDGAAAVHRVEGLAAFLADDPDRARIHLGAAREILPAWTLSSAVAPEGHPLRALFDDAPAASLRGPLPAEPGVAWAEVDGRRAADAPTERPYLLQRFGPDGAVLSTALREGLPEAPAPAPEPIVERPRRPRRAGVAVGAGLAAVGVGALVGSALAHERYWDPTVAPERLPGLQRTANGLALTGAVAGVGAGGVLAATLLSGTF